MCNLVIIARLMGCTLLEQGGHCSIMVDGMCIVSSTVVPILQYA